MQESDKNMSIPDAYEYVFQNEPEQGQVFRLGTVLALFPNGTAKVKFDGEETSSEKQYSYLSSYGPTVNDRVVMAVIAGTYIIMGKVAFNAAPATNLSSASVKGNQSIQGTLTVGGKTTVNSELQIVGSLNHDGSTIGFFGTAPIGKQNVSDLSSIKTTQTAPSTYDGTAQSMLNNLKTDVTNIRSTLLAVLNALRAYGLN